MGKDAATNSVFAVPLRILLAFVLLAFPFLASWGMASPWYVVACMPVFVLADIIDKWRILFAQNSVAVLLKCVSTAWIVQTLVVGVICLLGRGPARLFGKVETLDFGSGLNLKLMILSLRQRLVMARLCSAPSAGNHQCDS
jgi:hypothetical protein